MNLPPEIAIIIAHCGVPALLFTCHQYAHIDVHTRLELMISYGIGVKVTKKTIEWTRHGTPHRADGPYIETLSDRPQVYRNIKYNNIKDWCICCHLPIRFEISYGVDRWWIDFGNGATPRMIMD